MRITFVISALNCGGAQRVMCTMANHWVEQGRQVSIITVTGREHTPFYTLADAVNWVPLGEARASGSPRRAMINNARRLIRLRRTIRQTRADIVISFLDTTNVLTLIATRASGLPVIVQEHTDPNLSRLHPAWSLLRKLLYPRANRILVLSEHSKQFFSARTQRTVEIVPNPIQIDDLPHPVARSCRPQIVSMGRFGREKGFDLLIDAFALLANRFPEWDLVIWGDGKLRAELTAQRDRLGLTERVLLPGNTMTPHVDLRRSEIFALSSRREGFPMALAEAMACGLPAVAFDLPSGPKAIIRDGVDGLLAPMGNIPALAEALARLMSDDALRARMAGEAPHVLARYGVTRVLQIWDDVLERVVSAP